MYINNKEVALPIQVVRLRKHALKATKKILDSKYTDETKINTLIEVLTYCKNKAADCITSIANDYKPSSKEITGVRNPTHDEDMSHMMGLKIDLSKPPGQSLVKD